MNKSRRILKQMFDVKPTSRDGSLDLEKIESTKRTVIISAKTVKRPSSLFAPPKVYDVRPVFQIREKKKGRKTRLSEKAAEIKKEPLVSKRPNLIRFGRVILPERERYLEDSSFFRPVSTENAPLSQDFLEIKREETLPASIFEKSKYVPGHVFEGRPKRNFRSYLKKLLFPEKKSKRESRKKLRKTTWEKEEGGYFRFAKKNIFSAVPLKSRFGYAFSFAAILLVFSLFVPSLALIQNALSTKEKIAETGQKALFYMAEAKNSLSSSDFNKASFDFQQSYEILSAASDDLAGIGGDFSEVLKYVPGVSKIATAKFVLAAGEDLSLAGKSLAQSAGSLDSFSNPLKSENQVPLTDIFLKLQKGIEESSARLTSAEENISKISITDLPPEIRGRFIELKEKLPLVNSALKNFLGYSEVFLDVLGYNGPRKFLFLFQNNEEMRATGGFIGSYGILDISNGKIKKLLVDGIYNPDGQLNARIIPPSPIQKVSAVWTMHDSNWFPNFPTSAEKAASFYEKTGGPTVDGIIAVTPNLLQDLLSITGPIDMPEYDVTVDKDNFIEKTQYEVEVDYDKELNQPKKFIADLTPKILDKVFSLRDMPSLVRILNTLDKSLKEKQLLIYSKDYNIQKLISSEGWSGEILNTGKDYLSVINTNINGYKTDAMIEETISHLSEIQEDGSVIDTVSITRKHRGGNEKFDWFNKVNADYLRVYVPEGSKLLEASGQTREFNQSPLDYQNLGFKRDPQVAMEEDGTKVDEESGTRIYDENSKTVFANWVYVSPGESATLTYKYAIPVKLSFDPVNHPADSFSIFFQKQSGSNGSKLISEIKTPSSHKPIWHWPDDMNDDSGNFRMETVLNIDRFAGITLQK